MPWPNETCKDIQFYAFAIPKPGTVPIYNFYNHTHKQFTFHFGKPWPPSEERKTVQFYAFADQTGYAYYLRCDARDRAVIPRNLFVFWDDLPGMPPFVRKCIEAMRALNPYWHMHVLDMAEVCALLECADPFAQMGDVHAQLKADWVRLSCLEQLGGCWLDASCICFESVEAWIRMDTNALQGFTWNGDWKTMDCWALAVPAQHAFVSAWLKELNLALEMGTTTYLERHRGEAWFNDHLDNTYFTTHQAWNATNQRGIPNAPLIQIDPGKGLAPYVYLKSKNWDGPAACTEVLTASASAPMPGYFLKVAGQERRLMIERIASNEYTRGGQLALALRIDEGGN